MSDFFQTGSIATLHRLVKTALPKLEAELREFSKETKIALVLPCHVKELGTPALRLILRELKNVDYLEQIIVGIDGAKVADWRRAKRIFSTLPQKPTLIWNDGPRMRKLYESLREADLEPGEPGKGRNMWTCFGYVLASERSDMIVAHDCDIITYDRELLARLCYPVAHPNLGFDFCKGYSARFTSKLNGRVMRLMLTPLLRSLESILGPHPFLVYMDTFRYPLSGEVSFNLDIARRTRIPSDWGVEVGMLAEVFRVCAPKSICQSDISERYDHKHQELSIRDGQKGLNKMAVDIAKSIFRTMASEGIKLDTGLFDTLLSAYMRKAEDTVRFYTADAAINGLNYDRHEEEVAVATFVRAIRTAGQAYLANPLGSQFIPNWNRLEAALPNFMEQFSKAVKLDNAQA
jgi:glucosyl-3-phosphoglycerate synthase